MSNSPPPTRAAFCEEFNEDAQTALPETRQTASTGPTATTTTKKPKADASKPKALRDEFSDSGYSSHTAATLGSADSSSLESKLESYPVRPDPIVAESKTTLKDIDNETPVRFQSPEKSSLRRTESKSKGYETARKKNCECPECLAKKAPRVTPPGLDSTRPNRVDARTRQKDQLPPSPQLQRAPRPYPAEEAPVLQATQSRPRASTSQSYQRARPMSFHGGAMPDPRYMQPVFVDRQAPSPYSTGSPFPPPSYPPPQPSYFPAPLQPIPPRQDFYAPLPVAMHSPYEVSPRPRPRLSTRPQSMYYEASPPIMEYAQPMYELPRSSARPIERQPSRRQQLAPTRRDPTEAEADYRQMPPPPPPAPRAPSKPRQEQRPVIRHAATTSDAYPTSQYRPSARDRDEETYRSHPSPRKQSFEEQPRSHRPSVSRPPLTSDERLAQALQLERDMARMNITSVERDPASPKSKRRTSMYGHESLKDLEGSVEAYQASKSGRESTSIPPGDDMLRLIRKKTLTSNSSDAGSRISGGSRASREGSDLKASRRPSSDLKKRDSNDDAFNLRIPRGANVNLQPSIEGRAISLRHSKDGEGEMELRIGERGHVGGVVGSRPAIRDKSRRRYSIVEGQTAMDLEPEPTRSISRMPEEPARSMSRMPEDVRMTERLEFGDDGQRRIVRERIITRTKSRSRRSSRSAYGSRSQNEF